MVLSKRLRETLLRTGPLLLIAFACLLSGDAFAAKSGAAALTGATLMKSASVVGPLGINPFLAIAGFGAFATFTDWTPPAGMEPLAEPWVWVVFLILGAFLQFGRSTKLTKPIAEALGTGESLIAVVATALVMYPHLTGGVAAQADLLSGGLMIAVGTTAVMALIIMRTALDIIIWLSPFPFVDAAFQILKAILTVGLVALAVAFPTVAVVINVLLLIATAMLLRWALRTARFGVTIASDLTIGRFKAPLPLPRDEVVKTDLGPFTAFALDVSGVAKRTKGTLELKADRWFFEHDGDERPLGDGNKSALTSGFLGAELKTAGGTVLLPPRYKHLIEQISTSTHAQLHEKPSLLQARRPQPQATAL